MRYLVVIVLTILICLPIFYITGYGFTSAELQRDTSVNVAADVNGVITITTNPNYKIISADPQLSIDFSSIPAESLNQNSTLKLGNQSDPTQTSAFTIQNTSSETTELTLALSKQNSFDANTDDIVYTISDGNSTQKISVGDSTTITLTPGETLHVSIKFVVDQSTTDMSTVFSITGSDTNA